MYASSWVEINSAALRNNSMSYRRLIGADRLLAAVVKSNAYGHGMVEVAKLCEKEFLADWLCTATGSEALQLRAAGVTLPILVLSYVDVDPALLIAQDVDMVVYDSQFFERVMSAAEGLNKTAFVHIKVDTGLTRLGMSPDEVYTLICNHVERQQKDNLVAACALAQSLIIVRGLFTHLAESDPAPDSFAKQQLARFHTLRDRLTARGIVFPLYHTTSTAALDTRLSASDPLCRMGLGLYGLWPSAQHAADARIFDPLMQLIPALTWKTRIAQVKEVPAGSSIGYGRTYVTSHPHTIAVLPVGYFEGYDRRLSSVGHVLVHGLPAPVIGRISMNLTSIDVTGVPNVMVGDEVTLVGDHPAVHPQTVADHLGTISWDVVTGINQIIPRQYV